METTIEQTIATQPDFQLIRLGDEHEFWHVDIQNKTKWIRPVYAYDKNRHVHLCEIVPSYELHFLYYDYESIDGLTEEEDERLNMDILEGTNEAIGEDGATFYHHVSDIDGRFDVENIKDANDLVNWNDIVSDVSEDCPELDEREVRELALEKAFDMILEYEQGNPTWC